MSEWYDGPRTADDVRDAPDFGWRIEHEPRKLFSYFEREKFDSEGSFRRKCLFLDCYDCKARAGEDCWDDVKHRERRLVLGDETHPHPCDSRWRMAKCLAELGTFKVVEGDDSAEAAQALLVNLCIHVPKFAAAEGLLK